MNKKQIVLQFRNEAIAVTTIYPQVNEEQMITQYIDGANSFVTNQKSVKVIKEDDQNIHLFSQPAGVKGYAYSDVFSLKTDDMVFTDKFSENNYKLAINSIAKLVKDTCTSQNINYDTVELVIQKGLNKNIEQILKNAIQEIFCNEMNYTLQISEPDCMLSIDAGTGYYACIISEICNQSSFQLTQFTIAKDQKIQQSKNKSPSSLYIQKAYIEQLPNDIIKRNYDQMYNSLNIQCYQQGQELEDNKYILIQHYKRYIYYLIEQQDIQINDILHCSNIKYQEDNYILDVLHLFIALFLQISCALQKNIIKYPINMIRLAVPISAQQKHLDFMKYAIWYVFGPIPVDFQSEPEAAFSSLYNEKLNEYEQVILLDGGDGTFDCLKVEKQASVYNGIQQWRKVDGQAFNIGGSQIYDNIKRMIIDDIYNGQSCTEAVKIAHKLFENFKSSFKFNDDDKQIEILSQDELKQCYDEQEMQDFTLQQCGIKNFDEFQQNDPMHHLFIKNFTKMFEYKGKENIQDIIDKQEFNSKFFQNFKIKLNKQSLVKVKNMTKIFNNCTNSYMKKTKNSNNIQVLLAGGLFCNKLVAFQVMQLLNGVAEQNQNIQINRVQRSQNVIMEGLPIERVNICLRNYQDKAKYNLYMLMSKNDIIQVNGTPIQIKNTQIDMIINHSPSESLGPEIYDGDAVNTTVLLAEKDKQMDPANSREINKLIAPLNQNIKITFFRTKNNAPPFLPLHDNVVNNAFREDQNLKTVSFLIDSSIIENDSRFEEIGINPNQRYINVLVFMSFEYRKFHTQPVIELFIVSKQDPLKKFLYRRFDDVWQWFETPLNEPEYNFQLMQRKD